MNIFSRRCWIILSAFVLILFTNNVSFAETWESGTTGVTSLNLASVWTTSSVTPPNTEIFCVGAGGTIIYNDGSSWTLQHLGGNDLNGIWGSSPDDVYAVGNNNIILNYDGSDWTTVNSGGYDLNAVWGSSGNDIFAVGLNGTILHYYDDSWQAQDSGTAYTLNGVWGSSADNVFAVGENFTILHYDGNTWSQVEINNAPTTALNAVWGYSANSVYVVGEAGIIIWYAGGIWTLQSSEISSNIDLTSVWGASACNVYAAGVINDSTGTIYHFDGSAWSSQADLTSPLLGIHGTSMRDIFAVGDSGTFASYTLTGDEVYPVICATSPVADTTDIAIDASIMALFSTEMHPATITQATFTLTDGSSPVPGTVSYESGGFAVFTPDADLDYETTYTATLGIAIEDRFGYGIEHGIDYDTKSTWSFTTAAEASSSSSGSGGCFIIAARSR